ncbi:keratin-like protein [Candidatus Laterigemmans baculatus]|uniref:keratin-like protein n=1 Tax=Candidatus Laterigemmans baculatus TaxID=2770505 RepID=UPI0013DB1847|nr:keratin-like protein [Candidatus Laterigemmans baculatus]
MRRVIAPAFLAMFLFAGSSASAGFGLFHHSNGCDSCAVEPTCGCEIVEPSCGYEVAEPCCDSGHRCGGLLHKLFHHKKHNACDAGCGCAVEPSCGFEVAPVDCGCAVEPACGSEVVAPCCGSHHKRGGLFHKLFHHKKHRGCDACCDVEPSCGYEVAPSCGCGL